MPRLPKLQRARQICLNQDDNVSDDLVADRDVENQSFLIGLSKRLSCRCDGIFWIGMGLFDHRAQRCALAAESFPGLDARPDRLLDAPHF
jgi:hypothetical protein